jgi:hypothetical protein
VGSEIPSVWHLNLDAEAELLHRGNVNPSQSMMQRCRAMAERLEGLVPEGATVFFAGDSAPRVRPGTRAIAWCPTPSAVRALQQTGAHVAHVLPWETLRAVNHRAFSAAIAQPLPDAFFSTQEEEILQRLNTQPTWLLKRPLSYRGNGRLRVTNPEDPRAHSWIRTSLRDGDGLQVEPEVVRTEDFGQHGYLSPTHVLTWGTLTRQRLDSFGQWLGTERCPPNTLTPHEQYLHNAMCERVAQALMSRGYHGPFGIDTFRWTDTLGTSHYNPLCEINARYSMGWAVGMGSARPDLDVA